MYLLALEYPPIKDWHITQFEINALKLLEKQMNLGEFYGRDGAKNRMAVKESW